MAYRTHSISIQIPNNGGAIIGSRDDDGEAPRRSDTSYAIRMTRQTGESLESCVLPARFPAELPQIDGSAIASSSVSDNTTCERMRLLEGSSDEYLRISETASCDESNSFVHVDRR